MNFESILSRLIENPESAAFIIRPLFDKYLPIVKVAADALFETGIDLQERYVSSGYAEAKAKTQKAKFDAYVNAGFTEEQAMSLLLTNIRQEATLVKQAASSTSSNRND